MLMTNVLIYQISYNLHKDIKLPLVGYYFTKKTKTETVTVKTKTVTSKTKMRPRQ